jgi:hypothetical protein
MARRIDVRAHDLYGLVHERLQCDYFLPQAHRSAIDQACVQQLIHQVHEVSYLAAHQVAGFSLRGIRESGESENLETVADRRERVAQLVCKPGHELVLQPVGGVEIGCAAAQVQFLGLSLGDVQNDADHALRLRSDIAEKDYAARIDPGGAAVRQKRAELSSVCVRATRFHRRADRGTHGLAVVGVNPRNNAFERERVV